MNLDVLNAAQKGAVLDTEGAVLVFAGAGSGKTRVLTHRIAYLIEEKRVNPWNILAITFTNKATNEMKERLQTMLGDNDVWVSTFHSLCVKILFRFSEKIGYSSGFSIYDESATGRVLTKVLREKHLEDDKDKTKYAYHIGLAKNAGMEPDEYFNHIRAIEKDAMTIVEVYERYEEVLKENNAMDFDDLLIKCYRLLKENEDVRRYYSEKFRYIHVDEFQDTNAIQFDILKLLSEKWKNVFAVGDDDQSIYGWRGADIRNILEFEKSFPGAKIHKLEQNYRSTQAILDCANKLIKNNSSRRPKELFTDVGKGEAVEFRLYNGDYEEVDGVIDKIAFLKRSKGYLNKDFAILVRNNSLTRIFETSFNKRGIKYRIYGGFKFFDRKEILDVLAYMRVLVNPADAEAIARVINFPKRGIGDTTVEQLIAFSAEKKVNLYDVIMDIENTPFSSAVTLKVGVFRDLIGDLKSAQMTMDFPDFCEYLVKTVGFETFYRSTQKEEDDVRWANIEEFLTYVRENYNKNVTLEEFLHTVMLNTEKNGGDDADEDRVVLATMHSVKGLEFPVVFIVACEEGIIPSSQSLREANGVDEERRVMYVAVTRAQKLLFISAVKGYRRKYNRMDATVPSRFMNEANGTPIVPNVKQSWQKQDYSRFSTYGKSREWDDDDRPLYVTDRNPKPTVYAKPQLQVGGNPPPPALDKDVSKFIPGAKVKHPKYGIGTVIIVDGTGTSATVTVAFKDLGIKKFALLVAPLEIV